MILLCREFQHKNLVKFHGICRQKGSLLIVTELMPRGELEKVHCFTVAPAHKLQTVADINILRLTGQVHQTASGTSEPKKSDSGYVHPNLLCSEIS